MQILQGHLAGFHGLIAFLNPGRDSNTLISEGASSIFLDLSVNVTQLHYKLSLQAIISAADITVRRCV